MRSDVNAWLLIGGQSISIMGESLLTIILPLMVLDITGSVFQVSIVFILTQLPVFMGFLSGNLRHHFSSQTLIVSYDFIRFVLLVSTAVLIMLHSSIYAVYALVFLFNLFSIFFRPTRIEFITHIVAEEQLKKFNSIDRTFEAIAYAFGFGLGGYAYYYLQLPLLFGVAAIPFFLSGISILFMGNRNLYENNHGERPSEASKSSFLKTAKAVNKHPMLSFLVYGEAISGLAFGIYISLFVVYARKYLGADSIFIGHSEAIQALTAAGAGLLISFGLLKMQEQKLGFYGYLGMAFAILTLGFNSWIWLTYIIMACIGFFNMMYSVAIRTLIQLNSSKEEMIHVFALESVLSRISMIIGSSTAGAILSLTSVSVNSMFFVSGIILLLVSTWACKVLLVAKNR